MTGIEPRQIRWAPNSWTMLYLEDVSPCLFGIFKMKAVEFVMVWARSPSPCHLIHPVTGHSIVCAQDIHA